MNLRIAASRDVAWSHYRNKGLRMRRVFHALGVVFAAIIVIVAGLIGFTAYRGSALDTEAKTYVDQAVIDVGKNWDKAELLKRASPDLLSQVSPGQITTLFQNLGRFGPLVHYDGAKGQAVMSVSTGSGAVVRAHYEANATFQNGPVHFRIDLSKHDERWMIDGFFVDLSPPATNPVSRTL
jgi:hypothetical protein